MALDPKKIDACVIMADSITRRMDALGVRRGDAGRNVDDPELVTVQKERRSPGVKLPPEKKA